LFINFKHSIKLSHYVVYNGVNNIPLKYQINNNFKTNNIAVKSSKTATTLGQRTARKRAERKMAAQNARVVSDANDCMETL
jgi:hypothetical protein